MTMKPGSVEGAAEVVLNSPDLAAAQARDAENWRMGSFAAWELHKVAGILDLVVDSVCQLHSEEPMPDAIHPALEVARKILREAMEHAQV